MSSTIENASLIANCIIKTMRMPRSKVLSSALFIFALISYANINNNVKINATGENSSVEVNIKNNVNTKGTTTTPTSETSTSVNISQTGEGTSLVKINGKEWKLEGPGEINVKESFNSSSNPSPTITPSEKISPTQAYIQDDIKDDMTIFNLFRKKVEEIGKLFQQFFLRIFGTS